MFENIDMNKSATAQKIVELFEELKEKTAEIDKFFKNSPELIEVYKSVIKNRTVEVDGMKWPLETLITATSNAPAINWWQTAGGSKVLRYFQDAVIDAVVNITGMKDDKYADNTRLFWIFLTKIQCRSAVASSHQCGILAKEMARYASGSPHWEEIVYESEMFREHAIEFAESIFEAKKIYLEMKRSAHKQAQKINSK